MRITKATLERRVEELVQQNMQLQAELNTARRFADYDHKLVERLLTIFERTAGEAQLRLSGAGSLAATGLEQARQETYKLQRGIR